MQGIRFTLTGSFGHFKRPETNNNPCTYSYMHKIAIIGFIGAVTGINRTVMAPLFSQLCEDLLVSIKLLNPVVKEPHAFTKRKTPAPFFFKQDRRYCEYLRDPSFEFTVALKDKRSEKIYQDFCTNIKNNRSPYPTYLGVANCAGVFEYIDSVEISEEKDGAFSTDAVISVNHEIITNLDNVNVIFERVPTYADNMYYHPNKMIQTVVTQGVTLEVKGPHRTISGGTKAWFI